MVSHADNDLNFRAYGLRFVPIVITLIFLIVSIMLIRNKDYGLKRVGLAISQKHHHNNNINIINTDKIAISSRKATTTKKMSTKHHSNASITSNGMIDGVNNNNEIVGIFAVLLFVLSLIAYSRLKSKRIMYVAIAFAIFAVRVIISKLDLFIPEVESTSLELLLAIMGFTALGLFFMAIVRREKIRTRTIDY